MTFPVGALVLIRYGNGTQAARVREVTPRGAYKLDRFYPDHYEPGGTWRSSGSTMRADDVRIIGDLPANDKRRSIPGFQVSP